MEWIKYWVISIGFGKRTKVVLSPEMAKAKQLQSFARGGKKIGRRVIWLQESNV
jgi:hypothetical protein